MCLDLVLKRLQSFLFQIFTERYNKVRVCANYEYRNTIRLYVMESVPDDERLLTVKKGGACGCRTEFSENQKHP